MIIYVVCEIAGGHLLEAFTHEEDAKSFLNWEEAVGRITAGLYTIQEVKLSN